MVTILFLVAHKPLLQMVFGQVEPEVMSSVTTYLIITALSICPLAVYNSSAALIRAMNDSRTTMWIAIVMNLINFAGNAILIYGAKIGVAGAAIATTFSRIVAALIAVFLWMPSFTLPNTLRAAGDVVWTMVIAILSMWTFRIGFAYLFNYFFHWGLLGVWVAMTIDWGFRSLCYELRYHGHKWERFMKKA